jgi:15-cis-phytoene synthase
VSAAIPADLLAHADATLARGSTSFAAAAKLLDPQARRSAALLYAWCRHCDDVIDGQTLGHGTSPEAGDAAARLKGLERDTRDALAGRPPPAPAFRALAAVAALHAIPSSLPLAHLDGFRRDVEGLRYETLEDLLIYCWGVAGVVGEMMARIMGVEDRDTLDRAADLGLAFQLSNIARDVAEDWRSGRLYLPLAWLAEAGVPAEAVGDPARRAAVAAVTARLVAAAEPFYDSALVGVGRLPPRAAMGVAAARSLYRAIGRKVAARGEAAWGARLATSRGEKLRHLATGVAVAAAARTRARRPRDPALWRMEPSPV